MENTTIPPQKPILVDEPPTFEYVETKRNWIKYLEIGGILVIISIPLILSLFKIDYSVKRVYELVNPAYIGTSPGNDAWSGIITAAKKIVQPVINISNNDNTAVTTEQPTSTPTPYSYPAEQTSQQSNESQQQTTNEMTYPASNEEGPSQQQSVYDSPQEAQTTVQESSNNETVTSGSEGSPSPEAQPSQEPPVSQVDAYAAYTACYGKKKDEKCSYTSSYGYKVSGVCKPGYRENLLCTAYH